ncbi:MAG: patatin-like phospholipase family protein [Bacteroidales bacterium]|nr:patatin-like phospholipase family protein [Bacteroidales bacterium]
MLKRSLVICLLLLSLYGTATYAQKTVGLVLSGGGAKGLAHIGVIKALEEHDIAIDYIAGTSMGAIIGGLYATGYSPREMEELVTSPEFVQWANGIVPEKFRYHFKRNDAYPSLFSFNIEVEDSVPRAKLPSSLLSTHMMDYQFLRFMGPAQEKAQESFNNLFVPFRCVATDITNNKEVVFDSGNLALAIRTSMTFPFYYRPIETDSIVYFDGGMKNNFPADVIQKDFDPDYLIGSKTAKNAAQPEADDILLQIQNVFLGSTDYTLPDSTGFLIDINLDSTSLFNFRKAPHVIRKGYRTTIRNMDSLMHKIPVRRDKKILQERRESFRSSLPTLQFKKVRIRGVQSGQKRYIQHYIRRYGDTFSVGEFKDDYFKLLADDNIRTIYPRAYYDSTDGQFDLLLNIDQQSRFRASIGGNISSSSINQGFGMVRYHHLGKYSKRVLANVYYGRLYSSAKLEGRIDFPWFPEFYLRSAIVLNRWDYFNSSNEPFFEDVRPAYLIYSDNLFKGEAGLPVDYNGTLKLGFNLGNTSSEYYLQDKFRKADTAETTNFNYFTSYLEYDMNTLNYRQFPSSGSRFQARGSLVRGKEQFEPGSNDFLTRPQSQKHHWLNLHLEYQTFWDISENFKLGFRMEGNYSNRDFFSNYHSTLLHGSYYNPLPHSKTLHLPNYIGNHYLAAGLNPVLEFNEKFQLRAAAHAFIPYKKIIELPDKTAGYAPALNHYHTMLSGTMVYHTVFGPASLTVNYYEKRNKNFYFLFNFGFILFNEQGLK